MSESKTCGVCGYEWHMVGHTISCSARADRGISPAQLREKVEALEKRMHYIDASLAVEQLDALAKRIEALEQVVVDCIKRIEELERRQPKHEPIMIPDAVNDGTGWKPR